MRKVSNFLTMIFIAVVVILMTSCKEAKPVYIKVDVVAFAPVTATAFSDTIKQIITDYAMIEDDSIVPLMTLKSVNRVPDFVLTQKIERGMANFNGDGEKVKFVKGHIIKNVLPALQLPSAFAQSFTPTTEQLMKYQMLLKNAEKDHKSYILFSSNTQDTTAQAHTTEELEQKITEEIEKGYKTITILYNMPFVSPTIYRAANIAQLTTQTEVANGKSGTEKKLELDRANLNIEATLNKDANDAYLWYLRAVNRTYAGDTKAAIEYLENAAKISIEKDSAFMIMNKITMEEGTKLSFLKKTQFSKLKAVKNALEKNDVNLIGIVMNELLRIGTSDQYILYLNGSNDTYNNIAKNYSVSVLNKDGNNNVTMNINLPELDSRGNKSPRSYPGKAFPYGVETPLYYENNSMMLSIKNDSPSDKSFVKLILTNRKMKTEIPDEGH